MEAVLKFRKIILGIIVSTLLVPIEAQTSKGDINCEELWDQLSFNSFYRNKEVVSRDSIPSIKVYKEPEFRNESYTENAKKYISYAKMINIKNMAIPNWENLSQEQKETYVSNLKQSFINKADSIQRAETADIIYFTIENNTPDTISIQMQDFTIITILEAKNASGAWQPVEYWSLSDCDHSFFIFKADAYTKNYFARRIIHSGNFHTKGRIATFVYHQIIYSDEFDLTIDECKLNIPQKVLESDYKWLGDVDVLNEYLKGFRNRVYMR